MPRVSQPTDSAGDGKPGPETVKEPAAIDLPRVRQPTDSNGDELPVAKTTDRVEVNVDPPTKASAPPETLRDTVAAFSARVDVPTDMSLIMEGFQCVDEAAASIKDIESRGIKELVPLAKFTKAVIGSLNKQKKRKKAAPKPEQVLEQNEKETAAIKDEPSNQNKAVDDKQKRNWDKFVDNCIASKCLNDNATIYFGSNDLIFVSRILWLGGVDGSGT